MSSVQHGRNEGRRWAIFHQGFTNEQLEDRRSIIERNWGSSTAQQFWYGAMDKRQEDAQ